MMARVLLFLDIQDDDENAGRMPIQQTASSEGTSNNFVLYPNPNKGKMTLDYSLTDNETGTLVIYDIAGKIVSKHNFNSSNKTMTIDEHQLEAGVYFYEITVNGVKTKNDKLIIIK